MIKSNRVKTKTVSTARTSVVAKTTKASSAPLTNEIGSLETDLNHVVRDYLSFGAYTETLRLFEVECHQKGKLPASTRGGVRNEIKETVKNTHSRNQILTAFDDGNAKVFFSIWDHSIPAAIRKKDSTALRLEFYANIYFAVFPLLMNQDKKIVGRKMKEFKLYLETRGSALCKTTEFLAFYALPFVPDPRTHPSFKPLFLDHWAKDIKARIEGFLSSALKSSNRPALLDMFQLFRTSGKQSASTGLKENKDEYTVYLRQQMEEAEEREIRLIETHNQLQAEYHSLVGIAAELCDGLQEVLHGNTITPAFLSGVVSRLAHLSSSSILSRSLSQSLQRPPSSNSQQGSGSGDKRHQSFSDGDEHVYDTTKGTSTSLQQQQKQTEQKQQKQQQQHIKNTEHIPFSDIDKNMQSHAPAEAIQLVNLDYELLKADLRTKETHKRALLLQSLRWRLTTSSPGLERKQTLANYIHHDLLQCRQGVGGVVPLLSRTISENDDGDIALEYYARLINTMASLSAGRSYLLETPSVIERMQVFTMNIADDSATRQHMLGALQKLSLRRTAQSAMIEKGMIEWLVSMLGNLTNLSEYTIEYATALLMNLCLRTRGKRKCVPIASAMLSVMADLLENENTQVRTYVHGTLYSVLSQASMKEQAYALGLDEAVRMLIDVSEEALARQLEYILNHLDNPEDETDDTSSDSDVDDDDEVEDEDNDEDEDGEDVLEGEDDMESLQRHGDEPDGEQLLKEYAASNVNLVDNEESHSSRDTLLRSRSHSRVGAPKHTASTSDSSRPLSRPVTPLYDSVRNSPMSPSEKRTHSHGTSNKSQASIELSKHDSIAPSRRSSSKEFSSSSDEDNFKDEEIVETVDEEIVENIARPPVDHHGSEAVAKALGSDVLLTEAEKVPPPPSEKTMAKIIDTGGSGATVDEYYAAFSTRTRVPRTPTGSNSNVRETSSRPTSAIDTNGRTSRSSHTSTRSLSAQGGPRLLRSAQSSRRGD